MKYRDYRDQADGPGSFSDRTSLFPFFPRMLQSPFMGWFLAAFYAVTMLFIALQYHTVGDYNVETDFFWSYIPVAKSVLHGSFIIEGFRGPAYPVILACANVLFKDFFRAGVVISVLSAAGTLFFAFQLMRRLFRADIAFVGTFLIGVNRTFVQYSYSASTDMVFNCLLTASVYMLLRNEQRQWRDILISSALAAVAYLTRFNGVFILAAVPAILMLINPFHLDWKERLKTSGVFLGVFLCVIAPWGVYCLLEKGSFFFNLNYLNIAYEMFAKGRISWDQYWNVEMQKFHSLSQVIFADPGRFISTIGSNLYQHFVNDMELLVLWPLGLAMGFGVFVLWKEKATKHQLSLIVLSASFFAVLLLVFYGERFSMFLLLMYVALAVRGLAWRKFGVLKIGNRISLGTIASWLLIVWTCVQSYEFNRENINSGPQEIVLIADWYKKNYGKGNEDQFVVSRKPHIAYYLGMSMTAFPYVQNESELQQQVQASKASFFFFSSMEAYMRPQFQALLDPKNAPPWLTPLVYTVSPPAVLYKVNAVP
jgi:4-amino-4-deoxy-L-arabinose transferase-like glycosyltransferase